MPPRHYGDEGKAASRRHNAGGFAVCGLLPVALALHFEVGPVRATKESADNGQSAKTPDREDGKQQSRRSHTRIFDDKDVLELLRKLSN
jgi:hypothetical protein